MTPREHRTEVRVRLSVLRHNTGGTYQAAARTAGVCPASISAWDRGDRLPRSDSMEKLRAAS